MRILILKPKHIGDTLVLTPTIVAIKRAYPEAEIWVVVRRGCEGMLAGCPEIHRILTITAVDKHERKSSDFWMGLRVILQLLSVKFDYVFELGDGQRARLLVLLSRARRRYAVKPVGGLNFWEKRVFTRISRFDWTLCHRVEKDFYAVAEFLELPQPIPALRFDRQAARDWAPARDLGPFCVMQIGKRQSNSRWHREGWEKVGRWLLQHIGNVIITSGSAPAEIEEAAWLRDRLGSGALATLGQANWPQMAGLLYRARLYVGLDTATMHLAAACGCPAVALFGPTVETHWQPWHSPHRIVTGSEVFTNAAENVKLARKRTMAGIAPEKVIAACEDLLAESASREKAP